ncbi:bifunctional adenosylcobinamide kinase/adenosylcobinamide-phosphate guanylyltransferase [Oceanotoga sp. DSM 15011]|uniref:bifunctional adenosylcobinamide kinase/adenosylcobinamide-phosphate guanylyltransferase n=1 Tax=Oceanotoga sp. DSM 15011 TaxID=2984951 RepID=UPI0021F4232C|nr:bifunctional adenosylcobinamide kinase/adenosylcobinamide-phosphate guanylyltransferase [Oceanotoga sp. DSM 15011]UYP01059.1 bifunctional adenosylcobinamide kinase/adenosylcobinamide-phosphate guanylyltransferase [Oceanotoga sp. DSM 15011]
MYTLITGGQACGKSTYAQILAEKEKPNRVYIATAQIFDEEMRIKVDNHIKERGENFFTVEEPFNPIDAFKKALTYNPNVILMDCITMWTSNLLLKHEKDDDSIIFEKVDKFIDFLKKNDIPKTIFVTNEVGWGIIPENTLARRYVRILGTVNKKFAKLCNNVFLMVSGIEVKIK